MAERIWDDECLDIDTPYPLEEMFSYCVQIEYGKTFWYAFVDTIDLEEAKSIGLLKFQYYYSSRIRVKNIKCMKVSWLEPITDPEIYWLDNYTHLAIL